MRLSRFSSGGRPLLVTMATLIYFWLCLSPGAAQPLLSEKVDNLSNWLKSVFKSASQIKHLTKIYEDAHSEELFRVEAVDAVTEVNQLTEQIGDMVARKTQAIKESVAMAEEVASNYRFKAKIEKKAVSYLSALKLKDENSALEYDRHFLQKVAKNQSTVIIPTDIFDGRTDILNQLMWTGQVERKLANLVANEEYFQDTVRYMYLVTDMGLMRMLPGMKWTMSEITNMYDARRTSWYVEGSTCAKDMLLLIDTSGSMQGQNLLLTKQAAKSLINTLGANDYVAVGQYPGKALSAEHTQRPHLLHDKEPLNGGNGTCFQTFVQATKRHKQRLFKQIESITAKGLVNLTEALEFAYNTFDAFQNGTSNNHGAKCSSIIGLLTDGDISSDMDQTNSLIEYYKAKSEYLNKVRIFVFSVGRHTNPDGPLIQLACKNGGTFTDVPAMGAVTSNVQEGYLTTLRKVGALYEAKLPIAERSAPRMMLHSHFDPEGHRMFLFFTENQMRDLGLGILTSLTMPIYNTTGNNSFLGLVGTDIAIRDWVAMVPKHRLGPNGYAFALDSNGYVVFHPELKTKNGWHREPVNMDLLEVELDEPEKRRIRTLIVSSLGKLQVASARNETPMVTVETLDRLPDGVHVNNVRMNYSYKRIPGTPYAVSIALPAENASYVAFGTNFRPSFEQLEGGSLWTVSLANTTSAVNYPSPWAAYLVPPGTPYCSEYYTPPPVSPPTHLSANESDGDNSSAAARPTPPLAQPAQPVVDEHHVKEQTERLKLAPESLGNLLQTLALNGSVCSQHWSAALALDLVLLDAFFKNISLHPPEPYVVSLAATGPGGVTGIFPPGEAARYRGWGEGWSSTHFQRAALMPRVLFASVPCMSEDVYNRTIISTEAPSTTAAAAITPTFGLATENASLPAMADAIQGLPDVTFYQAVTIGDQFGVAVLGVTLSGRWLASTIFTSAFADLCDPSRGSNTTCYLVEDGGYILAANEGSTEAVGHFLGTVDKPLMRHLVFNLSVFESVQEFDFQGTCPRFSADQHASKAGASAARPSRIGAAVAAVAVSSLTLMGQRLPPTRQSLLTTATMLGLPAVLPTFVRANVRLEGPTIDCIKMGYRYYRRNLDSLDDTISATVDGSTDELGRRVQLAALPGTNLLLVAVQRLPGGPRHPDLGRRHSTGAQNYDQLLRDPIKSDGPDVCNKDYRYRERPATCYQWHPKEYEVCSPASLATASNAQLMAASIVTVVASLLQA